MARAARGAITCYKALLRYIFSLRLGEGQRDDECCPLSRRTLGSDAAAVALGDFTADGKPHARAFIVVAAMQALEQIEDAIEIDLLETDTVILYPDLTAGGRDLPGLGGRGGIEDLALDPDPSRFPGPMEF